MTYLHIFKGVLLADAAKNILFTRFLQLAGEEDFVEDIVCLGEREDDVELANVAVVLVHLFDISVDNFEGDQLVIFGGASGDEEERCISAIDNLCIYVDD